MKVAVGIDLKIKCKSVGVDNIKVSDNRIHDYRELFNEKGYKVGEVDRDVLSITIPMLYSSHNGNNLRFSKNSNNFMKDIKKTLKGAGVFNYDLEKAKSRSVEINCNFDTKKVNPSIIVNHIAKVLEYYNKDNNIKTYRACHTIKPNLNHPMANNYNITNSTLHKENKFNFKIYNKTHQIKNSRNIDLEQNILRIEIKFKGSYLAETSIGTGISNIIEKFENLSQLYMKHTKSKLIDKLIKFQEELEREILKELREGKGLTEIYKSYKYYILDSKVIENILAKHLESIGEKEAKKVAQNRVKELKKNNKELKDLTGAQNILNEIIEYFSL